MARKVSILALTAVLLAAGRAFAGTVDITMTDGDGNPAADTVVALTDGGPADAAVLSRLPGEAIIDQRDETFIPLVSLIRRGGHVVFTNHDHTMHQVYSFSAIKQFEFEIDEGQRSEPVAFDKAGLSSIGCNIHDQMITYVYVADMPFTALTDSKGKAEIAGVPAGTYRAKLWNPRLVPGTDVASPTVTVGDGVARLSAELPLMAAAMRGMKHPHTQSY